MNPSEIAVLIVEDNPVDAMMVKMALKEAGLKSSPTVVDDGGPAIDLLGRKDRFTGHPRPDLIVLDLNLKMIDGPEVLEYIRGSAELSGVCVAVLSSSPTEQMMREAAQADCYFSKPSDLASFQLIGKKILSCYDQLGKQ